MRTEASLARTAMRRMALITVATGIAAIGGLTTAPLAQAAQATGVDATVIPGVGNGNGPDAFMVYSDGTREPVFFCDPAKPNQRHSICVDVTGDRF